MAPRQSLRTEGRRGADPPGISGTRAAGALESAPVKWSGRVSRESNALDLEPGVFRQASARAIALSLKRSALASGRRKSEPFRSAMSMLNFYINRAGRNLPEERRRVLQDAKTELRRVFGRAA